MKRLALLAVALLVGATLVLGAGLPMWDERGDRTPVTLSDETVADAGCSPVVEQPVESNEHIADGPIAYADAPPAAGDHRDRWAYFSRNFYEVADRPEVGELVHNLEHGYNVLWYDETVIEDAGLLGELRALAELYDGAKRDPATALIAAPWTAADGPPFPDGMSYALTHWYADPTDRTRSRADERAVTQYCARLSADVVRQWMEDYPLQHAPEGFRSAM